MSSNSSTTVSPAVAPLAYVRYLNLIWAILMPVCQIVAIGTMGHLLYISQYNRKRLKVESISLSMLIYFFFHMMFSALGLVHNVHALIKWFAGEVEYSHLKK
jgi:hypothetical protein